VAERGLSVVCPKDRKNEFENSEVKYELSGVWDVNGRRGFWGCAS